MAEFEIVYCNDNTYVKFADLAAATLWLIEFKEEKNVKDKQYSTVPLKPLAQFNYYKKELIYKPKNEGCEILLPWRYREMCDLNKTNYLFRSELKLTKDDNTFKLPKGEVTNNVVFIFNHNKMTKKVLQTLMVSMQEAQNKAYMTVAYPKTRIIKTIEFNNFDIRLAKEEDEIHATEYARLMAIEPSFHNSLIKNGVSRNLNQNLKRACVELAEIETKKTEVEPEVPEVPEEDEE